MIGLVISGPEIEVLLAQITHDRFLDTPITYPLPLSDDVILSFLRSRATMDTDDSSTAKGFAYLLGINLDYIELNGVIFINANTLIIELEE